MWKNLLVWGTLLVNLSWTKDIFVQKGQSTTLTCERIENEECKWSLNEHEVSAEDKNSLNVFASQDKGICELKIQKFDPKIHFGLWKCLNQKSVIQLFELTPPKITIFGSANMFANTTRDLACIVTEGSPRPTKLQWIISSQKQADQILKKETLTQNSTSSYIQLVGKATLEGQQIICRSIQFDDQGHEFVSEDRKIIRIEKSLSQARSSDFQITSRYPPDLRGRTAILVLAKDKMSTFTCSTSGPWHVCQWKSPISNEPCGIFNQDDPRDCRRPWNIPESNKLNASYNSWVVSKRNSERNSCGISGLVTVEHEGIWNCEMQSKPSGTNDQYFHDQQYFEIKTVNPPTITVNNLPQDIQISENEIMDIKVDVSDGFPEPIIRWFLNSEPFQPEQLSSRHQGNSIVEEYRYVAQPKHSGKRLTLEIVQVDDEGKEVASRYESFLSVQAIPQNESLVMGGGIIAAIVIGVISSLLLCCILLLLFITRRRAKDKILVVKSKSPESGAMGTQTMGQTTATTTTETIGTTMEDLARVGRRGSRERLLKEPCYSELVFQNTTENIQARKLSVFLSPDEIEGYEYEGSGSTAGSLSSLDSYEDEPITFHKNTLSSNPKFKPLFQVYQPFSDDDEDSGSITISYEDSEV